MNTALQKNENDPEIGLNQRSIKKRILKHVKFFCELL